MREHIFLRLDPPWVMNVEGEISSLSNKFNRIIEKVDKDGKPTVKYRLKK